MRREYVLAFALALLASVWIGRPPAPHQVDDTWEAFLATPILDGQAQFADSLRARTGELVRLSGFMLPLGVGEATTHFLLSPYSPTCGYCRPGPAALVEVHARAVPPATWDPVTVVGTLALQPGDGSEPLFALRDATVEEAP